jgi:ribosome biogenesis GTPase / thiamine phosphate phosphatase
VQAALREETLDEARLENYRKLLREQEFLRRKMDPEARQEEKNHIKKLTRAVRRTYRHKIMDSET